MRLFPLLLRVGLLASAAACLPAPARAGSAPVIEVRFGAGPAELQAFEADLQRATQAAAEAWIGQLEGDFSGVELTVLVNFVHIDTASGRSLGSGFAGWRADGVSLWHQGAAYELLTGIDGNGLEPDVEIEIGIDGYLQGELWFDPDPFQRVAAVPADRTDAVSVLLHEWGHALGFNGWMDGLTGQLPGAYASTYDNLVVAAAGEPLLHFTGASAMAVYGTAVPLTQGQAVHLGNSGGLPGADLVPDLMNGVVFERGRRYGISALDLAVMADIGLPVMTPVPEPATAALLAAGLAIVALRWPRRAAAAEGRVGR